MASNEYYDSSGSPGTGADVDSSVLRAEYDAIEEGFKKMPVLSGNNNYPVFVNAGGSALESKTPAAALAILGGEGAANKDATGGYVGLTLFKINFKNALNTFTSFFTNSNTAARTYTFPDKDGTVIVSTDKEATGGVAGLTLFKINFRNAADTFTSFFTNANSAARTYTFQDRDGTIADNTDLALKASLSSPVLTGTPSAPTAAVGANTTQLATTAFVASAAGMSGGKWISGTTYPVDSTVWSPITYLSYRRAIAGAGTADPMADSTNWERMVDREAPKLVAYNYTVLDGDRYLVVNSGGEGGFFTLPTGAANIGRVLNIKTIIASGILNNASIVKPIDSDTAGTPILAATAGKWAELIYDGSYWTIMAGN